MTQHDLMQGPSRLDSELLRKRADKILFVNEFAVAYQIPLMEGPQRGYLSAWVRQDHRDTTNPQYTREQGMSGDDEMIRRYFAEMADDDTTDNQRIQRFIGDGK